MAAKKEEPKKSTALTKSSELNDAALAELAEVSGAGFENQTREDITMPVIYLLQAISPQCETVEGAKPGLMINSVTEELLTEFLFVPATTTHEFGEYVPRKLGGGFQGVHDINSPIVLKAKEEGEFGQYRVKKPDGTENELIEYFNVFGVVCDEHEPLFMAVLRFKSTKIKVYRSYNTRLQTCQIPRPGGKGRFTPPLFCSLAHITTRKEKNNRGEEYWNFVITPAVGNNVVSSLLPLSDPRVATAREVYRLVTENKVKTSYDEPQREPGEDDEVDGLF